MSRTVVAALCLAAGLLAGCAAEETPRAAPSPPHRTHVEESPPPAAPTAESTPSARPSRPVAPPPTRSPHDDDGALTVTRGGGGARSHLLTADEWPAAWSVTGTGSERQPVSRCHPTRMHDIGAADTVVRSFARDDQATQAATQAVARFADRKSAWRAEQVVTAWREDCARELRQRGAALGAVRHGPWLSVVEVAGVRRPQQRLAGVLDEVAAGFA